MALNAQNYKLHETQVSEIVRIFQDLMNGQSGSGNFLYGSATYDPASLADGVGATTTVTVTGAEVGDRVMWVTNGVDLQGITLTAWVSAANTVSVRFQNETAGTLDLASALIEVGVMKKNRVAGT